MSEKFQFGTALARISPWGSRTLSIPTSRPPPVRGPRDPHHHLKQKLKGEYAGGGHQIGWKNDPRWSVLAVVAYEGTTRREYWGYDPATDRRMHAGRAPDGAPFRRGPKNARVRVIQRIVEIWR